MLKPHLEGCGNLLEQSPCHVSSYIHPVLPTRLRHGTDVVAVKLDAELVVEDLLLREIVLARDARPILRDSASRTFRSTKFKSFLKPTGYGLSQELYVSGLMLWPSSFSYSASRLPR